MRRECLWQSGRGEAKSSGPKKKKDEIRQKRKWSRSGKLAKLLPAYLLFWLPVYLPPSVPLSLPPCLSPYIPASLPPSLSISLPPCLSGLPLPSIFGGGWYELWMLLIENNMMFNNSPGRTTATTHKQRGFHDYKTHSGASLRQREGETGRERSEGQRDTIVEQICCFTIRIFFPNTFFTEGDFFRLWINLGRWPWWFFCEGWR